MKGKNHGKESATPRLLKLCLVPGGKVPGYSSRKGSDLTEGKRSKAKKRISQEGRKMRGRERDEGGEKRRGGEGRERKYTTRLIRSRWTYKVRLVDLPVTVPLGSFFHLLPFSFHLFTFLDVLVLHGGCSLPDPRFSHLLMLMHSVNLLSLAWLT